MAITKVRRKFDHERVTTRYRANAKIGTMPYGMCYFERRPCVGETMHVITEQSGAMLREGYVIIDRILPDESYVLCSWQ